MPRRQDPEGREPDHAGIDAALETLADMLAQGDGSSGDCAGAWAARVAGTPLEQPMRSIVEAVGRFDFDAAAVLVGRLRRTPDRAAGRGATGLA